MQLSLNFSFDELTTTSHSDLIKDMRKEAGELPVFGKLFAVANTLLQPLRDSLGGPIYVNSGYRSLELNNRIGGARNSDHLRGCAADITLRSSSKNRSLWELAIGMSARGDLRFGQLILEEPAGSNSWIHISLPKPYRGSEGAVMTYDGKKYRTLITHRYINS